MHISAPARVIVPLDTPAIHAEQGMPPPPTGSGEGVSLTEPSSGSSHAISRTKGVRGFLRSLARQGPNGAAVSGLGGMVEVAVSTRAGQPLSTIRAGNARPCDEVRDAHVPELLSGGINSGGKYARRAACNAINAALNGANAALRNAPQTTATECGALDPLSGTRSVAQPELGDIVRDVAKFATEVNRVFGGGAEQLVEALGCLRTPGNTRLAGPLEPALLVAYSLHRVVGNHCDLALNVLKALSMGLNIGTVPASGEHNEHLPSGSNGPMGTSDLAWRCARLLAVSGGAGMDALLACLPPLPNVRERALQAESLKIYLECSDALTTVTHETEHVTARLAKAAAVKLWESGDPYCLSADEKCAYFAWRNGMRESGPGSDLAKAQLQLHKSLTQMQRAKRASKWRLHPTRIIGRHKTPFAALQAGTLGAHLDTDARVNEAYDNAIQEAVIAVRDALHAQLRLPCEQKEAVAIALAVAQLNEWQRQMSLGTVPEACKIDKLRASTIVAKAAEVLLLAGLDSAEIILRTARNRHRDAVLARHFRVELLTRFAKLIDTPGLAEKADAPARLESSFNLKPDSMSIGSISQHLARCMRIVPMGCRMKFLHGAACGINNTSLPGFPVAPDLRLRNIDYAMLELNTGGHAHELFLGKQVTSQLHAGLRGTPLGVDFGEHFQAGLTIGSNAGSDIQATRGLRLRFLRQLDNNDVGTDDHRDLASAFVLRMGEVAEQQNVEQRSPADVWRTLIVDPHFAAPFSASWQEHRQVAPRGRIYLTGGLDARVGQASGTAAVTLTGEYAPQIQIHRSERSGATPRTIEQVGTESRVALRGAISLSPPGKARFNLLSVDATMAGTGTLASARLFEQDGRLAANFIYQDIESETYEEYAERMRMNWTHWEKALGRRNLEMLLRQTEAAFRVNQRPTERWRIREHGARRFDLLKSALHLRSRERPTPELAAECAELEQQAFALATDFGTWWEPVGTWNMETNTRTRTTAGWNWWLQATAQDAVTVDRELSWFGCSTAQMNAASRED